MEPLFVNDYIFSEEEIKNLSQIRLSIRLFVYAASAFLLLLVAAYGSSVLQNKLEYLPSLILYGAAAVSLLLLLPFKRRRIIKVLRAQELTLGNGQYRQRRVEFFEDHFSTLSGSTFYYTQITKTHMCGPGLSIQINKVVALYLRTDSFTKGDFETFLLFLSQKGVRVPRHETGSVQRLLGSQK